MAKKLYVLYESDGKVFHVEEFGEWLKPFCGKELSNLWRCEIKVALAMGKTMCSKCKYKMGITHRNIHQVIETVGEWDGD